MHIKRFEAPTLEAALARVREELGPDALILSSRTLRRDRGTFGLLAREVVEVQAARERSEDRGSTSQSRREAPALSDPDAERERRRFEREVREELRALRAAVGRLDATQGRMGLVAGPGLDGAEAALVARLEPRIAVSLVEEWRELAREEPRRTLLDVLHSRLEQRCTPPRAVDGRRVRVLVGAAGVGKTTSLAKLAARNEEGEREVVLASLDDLRVGASDALRRYAELLDSPFHEVSGLEGLRRLLARRFEGEILVDTAGRSPFQPGGDALADLRERLGDRVEVDLVIDASARPSVQRAQLDRFARLSPDRVILTRRDELDDPAAITSLLLDPACPPISWCGTGQRVPEDFVVVEPEALVRDLIGVAA